MHARRDYRPATEQNGMFAILNQSSVTMACKEFDARTSRYTLVRRHLAIRHHRHVRAARARCDTARAGLKGLE